VKVAMEIHYATVTMDIKQLMVILL